MDPVTGGWVPTAPEPAPRHRRPPLPDERGHQETGTPIWHHGAAPRDATAHDPAGATDPADDGDRAGLSGTAELGGVTGLHGATGLSGTTGLSDFSGVGRFIGADDMAGSRDSGWVAEGFDWSRASAQEEASNDLLRESGVRGYRRRAAWDRWVPVRMRRLFGRAGRWRGDRLGDGPARSVRLLLARYQRPLAVALTMLALWVTIRSAAPASPPTVPVLTARRDLPAGHRLTGDDVRTVDLRADQAPAGRLDSATGLLLAGPLRQGEMLTDARTLGPGLLVGQPSGAVAVPVRLADPAAAAILRPGDRVDVLVAAGPGMSAADLSGHGLSTLAGPGSSDPSGSGRSTPSGPTTSGPTASRPDRSEADSSGQGPSGIGARELDPSVLGAPAPSNSASGDKAGRSTGAASTPSPADPPDAEATGRAERGAAGLGASEARPGPDDVRATSDSGSASASGEAVPIARNALVLAGPAAAGDDAGRGGHLGFSGFGGFTGSDGSSASGTADGVVVLAVSGSEARRLTLAQSGAYLGFVLLPRP